PLGVTTITYEARDAANNVVTTSFTVTVVDNIAPVFTVASIPANISVFADGSCFGTTTWTAPTATDNCAATVTQTAGPAPGATNFPLGVTTITYEARDAANNVVTTSFTVTVVDNIAPVFTVASIPANISVFADGSCFGTTTWTAPTATDNCAATVTQTAGLAPGATNFPLGVTTITYEARDAANNVTTTSFDVTVTDNTLP